MAIVNDRVLMMFSGNFAVGGAATLTAWLCNMGGAAPGYLGAMFKYPVPKAQSRSLRVKPITNTMATAVVFTVMKAGVATALTGSIPAGSTAVLKVALNTVEFADDDGLDLQFSNTNGNGTMYVCATVVLATYDDPPD